jgi:putative membrane protein
MWRPLTSILAALVLSQGVHAASPPETAAHAPHSQIIAIDAFVHQTAGAVKFEIASSQLALRKTKSDAVLSFARQIILDYSAAGMKFRQALTEAKLPMPRTSLDAVHKPLSDELGHTAPGKPFAKAYVELQARALRGDLELFETYAQSGDNERMRYFAQEMVPLLRVQLDQVEKLRR